MINHFLIFFCEKHSRRIHSVSDRAMNILTNYSWPGNVRELRHVMERGCILCDGPNLLVEHLPELELQTNGRRRATFQDPCRLGRHLGIYDPPRKALTAVPGIELEEMPRSGPRAMCCAGGTWSNCDRFAKQIQVGRLREARATGAEILVTACPKCQIHFRCTIKDPNLKGEIEIEMRDVAEVVAEGLSR